MTKNNNIIVLLIVLLLVFLSVSLPLKAQSKTKVTLKEHLTLDAGSLKIIDIVDSKNTDIDFIRNFGDTIITTETDTFQKLSLSKVYRVLSEAGADLGQLQIKMKNSIKIERGQSIELNNHASKKVLRKITEIYNIPERDIIINSARILPKLDDETNSDLAYFKKISPISFKNLKNSKLKVLIENVNGEEKEHTLYLNLNIETSVLMIKNELDSGTTLQLDHFIEGRQKMSSLDGKLINSQDVKAQTYKLISSAAKDKILINQMIRKSVLVNDGSLVTIRYKTPHLNISALGKIYGSGEIGQIVKVMNIDSERMVKGKLISPDLVEVIYQ
ncbi:flagella basal body P-ring formation protein FlgA [bacterium K02(2017)]|nr:flagella basal body P-ring formation protein FlgA [bacterium K02(2017)]